MAAEDAGSSWLDVTKITTRHDDREYQQADDEGWSGNSSDQFIPEYCDGFTHV